MIVGIFIQHALSTETKYIVRIYVNKVTDYSS